MEPADGVATLVVTTFRGRKCYAVYYDHIPRELFTVTPSPIITTIKLIDRHRYLTLTELISLYEQGLLL